MTRSGTGAAAAGFAGGELIITFAAIDGDVPQIEAVAESGSGSAAWVSLTQHEGWSFFAGKGSRLESVEPGSIINITSRETVTFAVDSLAAGSSLVFSYDGNVGATAIAHGSVSAANVKAALNSIVDHKGAAKFTFGDDDITNAGNTGFDIEMPEGVDGSKLGLSPADGAEVATISKSVAKNNNGKSFKVVRVENNKQSLANTGATKTTLAFAIIHNIVTDFAIALDDEIRWTQTVAGIPCQLMNAAGAAAVTPVKDVYLSAVSYNLAESKTDLTTTATHASQNLATGCSASIHRTTIVVDAMPDAMSARTTGANVEVEIKGAAGSCSVTEAVKGTYESDVCSSRGNCDGAAGLCTCHEGYSGEACETQTVLV